MLRRLITISQSFCWNWASTNRAARNWSRLSLFGTISLPRLRISNGCRNASGTEIVPKSESLDQFLAALFVLAQFQQNDCEIVMSRRSIGSELELFQGALQVPTASQKHAEVIASGCGFGIERQGAAEFSFGCLGLVLEHQVVSEIVMKPIGPGVTSHSFLK